MQTTARFSSTQEPAPSQARRIFSTTCESSALKRTSDKAPSCRSLRPCSTRPHTRPTRTKALRALVFEETQRTHRLHRLYRRVQVFGFNNPLLTHLERRRRKAHQVSHGSPRGLKNVLTTNNGIGDCTTKGRVYVARFLSTPL